jgi:hypothetical protein
MAILKWVLGLVDFFPHPSLWTKSQSGVNVFVADNGTTKRLLSKAMVSPFG